jgi:hypothetical protein
MLEMIHMHFFADTKPIHYHQTKNEHLALRDRTIAKWSKAAKFQIDFLSFKAI